MIEIFRIDNGRIAEGRAVGRGLPYSAGSLAHNDIADDVGGQTVPSCVVPGCGCRRPATHAPVFDAFGPVVPQYDRPRTPPVERVSPAITGEKGVRSRAGTGQNRCHAGT